ncbi:serine/threonine-protein phosphatase 2A regulatory subunit B'' subunit beta-like isoform X1 [Ylistrum balloti]|uniref:serine/threonine-protein phosphatase 2A regulatory subunit B'' subunit beta-like isoform X1 n=1 Tax=Ylistrum balloti TaxID=509963 RepID=UPI002905DE2C|nr:serine/threonine-protein phosphatase 2A regulatory subunit B'' subunit beta-like isoform X1 [Ylistrum balloti]
MFVVSTGPVKVGGGVSPTGSVKLGVGPGLVPSVSVKLGTGKVPRRADSGGADIMQKTWAGAKYVYTRVNVYHSTRIELRWKRSVHYCDSCDYGASGIGSSAPGVRGRGSVPCGAVHYGRCTPVSYPFPQNYRKKSPISPSSPGPIPVAKVIPTRPVRPEPTTDQSRVTEVEPDKGDNVDGTNHGVSSSAKDSKENISRDSHGDKDNRKATSKVRDKENKELSPPMSTAAPTITTLSDKDGKGKRKEKTRQLNVNIPKFYFPLGQPGVGDGDRDKITQAVSQEFSNLEGGKAFKQHMAAIIKACKLPLYWKSLLFHAAGGEKNGFITQQSFNSMWKRVFQTCHDRPSQFLKLLAKPSTNYLEEDDLIPLIQDVVDTHPGLTFLQEAPEFHSRYVNTVIARMFYCINRTWTGMITIPELRRSNFLRTLERLEEEDDINQIMDFFSYEHFYVVYCKFWELDKDHDLLIDKNDLSRHNDHAIATRVIDRIFSGCVTRGKAFKEGKMTYPEFVWFLLSEEDKRNPTSIEYWFRCMDLDGDGVISMYEMEYFYEEQMQKMEDMGIEKLPFEDCLCQMLDLVGPKDEGRITLADLKNCKMTNIFFDTFFNLDKFLEHEQRDPFANVRDLENDGPEPTDWEKYAAEEYENLVAEEGAMEQEEILYEDDFEPDDDEIIQKERANLELEMQRNSPVSRGKIGVKNTNDDIYDFSTKDLGY